MGWLLPDYHQRGGLRPGPIEVSIRMARITYPSAPAPTVIVLDGEHNPAYYLIAVRSRSGRTQTA